MAPYPVFTELQHIICSIHKFLCIKSIRYSQTQNVYTCCFLVGHFKYKITLYKYYFHKYTYTLMYSVHEQSAPILLVNYFFDF